MSQISGISPATLQRLNDLTREGGPAIKPPSGDGPSFKDLLIQSIDQVNTMQHDADVAVETLVTGGEINPAEVLTALQKADMAFRMMQQIRNKLMEAYQEIKDVRI